MWRGTRKYWFIALIFGLLVAALFYRYLHEIKTAYTPKDMVEVVKAKQDITRDTVINANAIMVESVPAQYVHRDALRDRNAVVGKVATSNIVAGEQILNQKLLNSNEGEKRLAYNVPENKRAISVAVNSVSGVSGFIQRGDKVDVVAVVDFKQQGESEPIPYSLVVLQNVTVLAVGQNAELSADKKAPEDVKTVTLAVSVDEAQRLALATEKGAIRLLLRSPVERGTAVAGPIGPKEFLK